MSVQPPEHRAIILFDGECGFCARTVQFVLKRDPQAGFRIAALQSVEGQALLAQHGLPVHQFDSVVLIEDGAVFTRSTAALRICRRLSGAWPLLALGLHMPRPWRDRVYETVARRRARGGTASGVPVDPAQPNQVSLCPECRVSPSRRTATPKAGSG